MNWLAHLYLADGSDESLLGNLFGDFIGGVDWKKIYSEEIKRGIKTHFAVDCFTDTHSIFQRSCRRVSEQNKRYSSVLIDIFYDHYLAKNWGDYSRVPLTDFIDHCYDVLKRHHKILPPRLELTASYMIPGNWLLSYREVEGIGSVLERLSRYVLADSPIVNGVGEMTSNYEELKRDFEEFFPLVIEHVKGLEFKD